MKIRIQKDFVRLRLSQSEVTGFDQSGTVRSSIKFGDNSLVYQLVVSENVNEVMVRFEQNCITIEIPASLAQEWTQSDKVGFENTTQDEIRILVEKDFKCVHKRSGMEDSDNYPNPNVNR